MAWLMIMRTLIFWISSVNTHDRNHSSRCWTFGKKFNICNALELVSTDAEISIFRQRIVRIRIHICILGCFSKDTLKKNKMSTPPHNWGVPRKIISRRRGWSNKSRGLALALKVWQNRRRFSASGGTYMAPEWAKMSYNHRGKCFRVIWGLSWQHLVCSSCYPSKRLRGSKITKSAAVG